MGIPVMVYGQSGSGKSTSLRNFLTDEVCVVNVSGKPLPFKTKIKTYNCDDYMKIDTAIRTAPAKAIVIDDATYLMTNEFMRGAKTTGYQKFPDDKVIYFMGHVDLDQNGNEKFKTIGKLLDEKVTLEGLFTVVLKTVVTDGKYQFSTHTNGADTVKSPMGMFSENLIDNDLKMVDSAIRDYWGLSPLKNEEEHK